MKARFRTLALCTMTWLGIVPSACGVQAGVPGGVADTAVCGNAISAVEKGSNLPQGLLEAIGLVESGRLNRRTGRVSPWPWTIDVAGAGHFFDTKAAAMEAVTEAQAAGIQSIDVGCMQINLQQHPGAFASLEQAFDPQINVSYAASFLSRLFVQTGSWPDAAAAYHSQTPSIAAPYRDRVLAAWHGAPPVSVPAASATASAAAAHRLPALRMRIAELASDRDALAAAGILPGRLRPPPVHGRTVSASRALGGRFD